MTEEIASTEQLSLLFTLSRAFSTLVEFEELLPSIIAQTKEALQAESSALLLLDEERQELYFPVTSDLSLYNGSRKNRPFVTVNCGALTDTLLESELFGHKRGAFTGAVTDKPGLFEVANGGTIFLDEMGETTPALQVKLLRALQEGEIRRVGETPVRRVDVRVISATNRDLVQEMQHKRFREDLYYRLSVFPIQVPPLRERREDIPLLIAHFLRRSSEKQSKQIQRVSQEALTALVHYAWPGNVRELENEIERAVALTPNGSPVTPEYLSERITAQGSLRVPLPAGAGTLKQARLTFEREYIAELLRQHQGNAVQTAKVLGLSRQMLQKKIKEYGLRAR